MPARPTAARGRESAGRSSSCRPTGSAVWGRGTSPRPSHPPVDRGSGRGGKPRPVAISSPSTSHAHALPVASPQAPPRQAPSSVAPPARRGLSPACPTGHCHQPVPVLCHGSDSTPMRRQLNWAGRARAGSSRAPHTQGSQRRTGPLHAAGPSSSVPGPASDTAGHLRAPPDSTPPVLPPQLACHRILNPPRLLGHRQPPALATVAGKDVRTPQGSPHRAHLTSGRCQRTGEFRRPGSLRPPGRCAGARRRQPALGKSRHMDTPLSHSRQEPQRSLSPGQETASPTGRPRTTVPASCRGPL